MRTKYICPKCRNSVNIGDHIILSGETKTGLKGIVMLNSALGNYTSHFSEDFTVVEGNKVTLYCPVCHTDLSSKKHKDLAHLIMVDEPGNEANIYFSQIYGEKCTYKIEGENRVETYGEHKNHYKPDWPESL